MKVPEKLKFAKTDEWVEVDGDVATIGISDFAQSQLSDIVYFEFKVDPDDKVKKGTPIATLESVKAAADVNSAVAGKVVEINEKVLDSFEEINSDPYGHWFVKIEISNKADLDDLMTASEYKKYCEDR